METDVEDEYLIRSDDQGDLKIRFLPPFPKNGGGSGESHDELFDVNIVGPNQGQIKLRVKPKMELPVGVEARLDVTLSSPDGDKTASAFCKITNRNETTKNGNSKTKETYSLPKLIEVYKSRKNGSEDACWTDQDYDWTGEDICKVFPSSIKDHLVDAVAVNMDAVEIHNYMRQKKLTDKNVEHLKRVFKVAVYLLSLIQYLQIVHRQDIEEKEEMVSYLMKGVGKILLPIVVNDEIMKEIEREE